MVAKLNTVDIMLAMQVCKTYSGNIPEHLVRRLHPRVPLDRRHHSIGAAYGRNGTEGSEPWWRRLCRFFEAEYLGRSSLSRGVVVDVDNRASAPASILRQQHLASRTDEVVSVLLVEDLVRAAHERNVIRLQLKLGDEAETAAAALERPEQIRVRRFAGDNLGAVSKHHIVAYHVVHSETILVNEVTHAANERQARNTNGLKTPADGVQPMRSKSRVHINPFCAGADIDGGLVQVDVELFETIEADEDAVINVVRAGVLVGQQSLFRAR